MLIDWCPQVCICTQDKGFLVDIVEAFSRKENIKLSYVWVPRSRALIDVKKGKYDLLIILRSKRKVAYSQKNSMSAFVPLIQYGQIKWEKESIRLYGKLIEMVLSTKL